MPNMFGKEKKKQELLDDMPNVFRSVMKQHNLSVGDFPDLEKFKDDVSSLSFEDLPKVNGTRMLKGKRLQELEHALNVKIPDMLSRIPGIEKRGGVTKAAV